jgi:uncharacterized repeat protein (TIGR02543 family)
MFRFERMIPLLLACLLLCVTTARAGSNAWTPIGPYGGTIRSIAVSPEFGVDLSLMTGIWAGLFASTDGGLLWQEVPGFAGTNVHQVAYSPAYAVDKTIFVAGDRGIQRSSDAGATWSKLVILPPPAPEQNVTALAISPDYPTDPVILAGTDYGAVFRSIDAGATWSVVYSAPDLTNITSIAFATSHEAFLVPGYGLVNKSSDTGATWQQTTAGSAGGYAILPFPDYPTSGGVIYASINGARISTDKGATWGGYLLGDEVYSLAAAGDFSVNHTLYAGTAAGVQKSVDAGGTWQLLTAGSSAAVATTPLDNSVLAAVGTDLMTSGDGGASWQWHSQGILGMTVNRVIPSPALAVNDTLFVATVNGGVYRTTNRGVTWERLGTEFNGVSSLALSPGVGGNHTLLAGTDRQGIFASSDNGQSWSPANGGLSLLGPNYPTIFDLAVSPAYPTDGLQLCAPMITGVMRRSGGGDWTSVSGLPVNLSGEAFVYSLAFSPDFANDQTAFAGMFGMSGQGGVSRSNDGGQSWSPANTGLANQYSVFPAINAIAPSPAFATDQTVMAGSDSSGVFRSTDRGTTWQAMNLGLENLSPADIRAIAFSPAFATDRTLFLADGATNVFRNDGGSGWSPLGPGLSGYPRSLAVSPSFASDHTLFAGSSRGLFVYTVDDQGPPLSSITFPSSGAQLSAPQIVIQGTADDGSGFGVKSVEVSLDNGATWHPVTDDGGIRHFATWRYTVDQPAPGDYLLRSRSVDLLGKAEVPAAARPFSVITYPLTVQAEPAQGGSVTVSPTSGSGYYAGSQVQLSAVPASGYVFTGWSGDATGSANPLTLTMDKGRSVTANFALHGLFLTATQQGKGVTSHVELYDTGNLVSGERITFLVRQESAGAWPATWSKKGSVTTANGTATKIISFKEGHYQLKAMSARGDSLQTVDLWIGLPQAVAPANNTITTERAPAVQWAPLPGATGYLVQSSPKSGFAAGTYQEKAYAGNITSGQLPELTRGVKQYWRVVGVMPLGTSLPSKPRTVTYREGTTLTGLTPGITAHTLRPAVTLVGNDSSGGGVAGRSVTFSYRLAGSPTWRSAGTAKTDGSGLATLAKGKTLPAGNYELRASFKGDKSYGTAGDAVVTGITLPE